MTTYTEDFIKEMYKKIGIEKPKQLGFQNISGALGIKVYFWRNSSQALFIGSQAFIALNENLTVSQQWQEFCHELSHVLQHNGHQGYRGKMPRSWIEYQENKANNFMYHACIPSFMLDTLKINDYTFSTVIMIQRLFNVEYEFALSRVTQYINNRMQLYCCS
ncbi:protein of unknown function [Lysinibacillus sp. AC-3]|uniref:ImmA/IrrE family metallo-endopeptidase n=1 Tax=unclassified Lysinibacillus TaxID=2636778 RepID=UPI0009C5414B|nr:MULTISPECIES: ImmA/IrrE family metallo-endopeptidase [unclassified Lysinibacillus]SKC04586.1 protein of unknown function [Lysinibacillus sp. AC-3]